MPNPSNAPPDRFEKLMQPQVSDHPKTTKMTCPCLKTTAPAVFQWDTHETRGRQSEKVMVSCRSAHVHHDAENVVSRPPLAKASKMTSGGNPDSISPGFWGATAGAAAPLAPPSARGTAMGLGNGGPPATVLGRTSTPAAFMAWRVLASSARTCQPIKSKTGAQRS